MFRNTWFVSGYMFFVSFWMALEEFPIFPRGWVFLLFLFVATLVVNNGSGSLVYILFDSGIQFGCANAVFSRCRLMTLMKVLVMTTTIGPGAVRAVVAHTTENRVGDAACAMLSRSWRHATDHGNREGFSRCGDDRGLVPQIIPITRGCCGLNHEWSSDASEESETVWFVLGQEPRRYERHYAEAGTTTSTHRRKCYSERALTMRFVMLSLGSLFRSIRVLRARCTAHYPDSLSVESFSHETVHVLHGSSHQDSFSCRHMEKVSIALLGHRDTHAAQPHEHVGEHCRER